jgi:hypothetical protein
MFFLSHGLRAKQDVLWVYSLGFAWFESEAYDEAYSKHVPLDVESERRRLMEWNYPLSVVTSYAASRLNLPLPWAIGVSHMVAFALGLLVTLLGARAAPLPFTLTVSFYALLAFLPGPVPTDHLFLLPGMDGVLNVFTILGNSGEVYSPLSFWQRNTALLIIIGALALRWSGKRPYPLLACIALFHINFAVVAVGLFVAADILKRFFRIPDVAAFLGLCLVGTLGCSMVYLMLQTADPWDWPSLFSQVASRLLAIAHIIAVFGASWWACNWLEERRATNAIIAVALVALPMTIYGAVGSWWQRGPEISASYSKIKTEAVGEYLTRPYFLVVRDLTHHK